MTLALLLSVATVEPLCAEETAANDSVPGWYQTTVELNLRTRPSRKARRMAVAAEGTRLQLVDHCSEVDGWAKVVYNGDTAYCASRYLKYCGAEKPQRASKKNRQGIVGWLWNVGWKIFWTCVVLYVLKWVMFYGMFLFSRVAYKLYWLLCIPFYFMNWLQRYASKPWRWVFKRNTRTDYQNRMLRERMELFKIPLYIVLTPLRFVNAFYYNIVVHCTFETMNYIFEVIMPCYDREGADDTMKWVVWLPWRVIKYPLWHGTLTFVESIIWTAVDTVVPALTLFHGTDACASSSITQSRGRVGNDSKWTGVWNVGGGNYAGNGIYFAPERSTALHYACGSLVVCRVTLGRVIDLGLAPKRIYDQCGHPNATGATKWGLEHDYVTGEWWRSDEGWWEYCMYDWQNRYNFSWRIRPLYVLSLDGDVLQRIPGGMHHWLFRRMVIEDLITWFRHLSRRYNKKR